MQSHHFYAGPHRTHDGRAICEACGDVETAKVHRAAAVSEEVREVEARRIGEEVG